MGAEKVNLKEKRLEQSIVGISAKIADAIEMARKAKGMVAESEETLVKAHLALEELYMSLNDAVLAGKEADGGCVDDMG